MSGIELFETTLIFISDGRYDIVNIAYEGDGTKTVTEAEWSFETDDHYRYTVFEPESGSREPLTECAWIRTEETD